jgi:5-methylcytosine-specific restriction endonuclease McrA
VQATLLLNASYEPMRLIPLRRALVLVIAEKAEVVEEGDQVLRSPRTSMRAPAVIRLLRYVQVPYKRRAALNLRALLARDGGTCQYCGGKAASIDHVVPRARGGAHVWENVVAACLRCNGKKADKTLAQLGWTLPRKPFAPKDTRWILLGVATVEPAWEEYLGSLIRSQ